MKVVFESNILGLELVEVVAIVLDALLLLLRDLLLESDLLVALRDRLPDGLVLLCLLLIRVLQRLVSLEFVVVDVILKLAVPLFELSDLFLQFLDLDVGIILTTAQATVEQGKVKNVLEAGDADHTRLHHCFLPHFLIVLDGTFGRCLVSHRLGLHLLQHVVLVDLTQCILLRETVDRACLRVQQAITILIELSLEIVHKLVHTFDLAL